MNDESKFMCLCCGREGLPIQRKKGKLKKPFHLKKLFCIHCGIDVNHVECRNNDNVTEFLHQWANGELNEQIQTSLEYLYGTAQWVAMRDDIIKRQEEILKSLTLKSIDEIE